MEVVKNREIHYSPLKYLKTGMIFEYNKRIYMVLENGYHSKDRIIAFSFTYNKITRISFEYNDDGCIVYPDAQIILKP